MCESYFLSEYRILWRTTYIGATIAAAVVTACVCRVITGLLFECTLLHSYVRMSVQHAPETDSETFSLLRALSCNTVWVLLLMSGGHFAGAVFRG